MRPFVLLLALNAGVPGNGRVPVLRLQPPEILIPSGQRREAPPPRLCLVETCGQPQASAAPSWLSPLALSSAFVDAPVAAGKARSPLDAAFDLFAGEGYRAAGIGHGLYLGNRRPAPLRGLFLLPERAPSRLAPQEDPRSGFGVDATLYFAPKLGFAASVRMGEASFVGLTLITRP